MAIKKQARTSEEIVRLNRQYVFFSWAMQSAVKPIAVTHAEGCYFWDADGKRYLDFTSQSTNVNIGHHNPKVRAAIKQQADRLCNIRASMATDVKGELGRPAEVGRFVRPTDIQRLEIIGYRIDAFESDTIQLAHYP